MFQAQNKQIKLLLQVDKDRPLHVLKKVHGDKGRILQILLNIISNSLKFTPSQGYVKVILNIVEEQVLEES